MKFKLVPWTQVQWLDWLPFWRYTIGCSWQQPAKQASEWAEWLRVQTCIAVLPRMSVQLTLTGGGRWPCWRHRMMVCLSPLSAASRNILSCGSIRCPSLIGSSGADIPDARTPAAPWRRRLRRILDIVSSRNNHRSNSWSRSSSSRSINGDRHPPQIRRYPLVLLHSRSTCKQINLWELFIDQDKPKRLKVTRTVSVKIEPKCNTVRSL